MNDTLDAFGATLKFGTVSASKPGFARVRLPDFDNLRTMWLPIAYPKTQDDQACWTYDSGEQVAVLMDARGEDGVIIGAVYSSADVPPITDSNVFAVRFKDGARLEYDRAKHVLTVSGMRKVVIEASAEVLLKADAKVLVQTPNAEFAGNVTIQKQLIAQGGMVVSGGAGAVVSGDITLNGNLNASGSILDAGGNSNHHSH
jgi:phage baseplate assembly protein V